MSVHTSDKQRKQLYGFFGIAIIACFIFGTCLWIDHVFQYRLIHYGLYNIALFDFRYYLNLSFLILIAIALAYTLIAWIISLVSPKGKPSNRRDRHSTERVLYSLGFSLVLILIASYAVVLFYSEIIGILKAHTFTARLGSFTSSPRETSIIFLLVLGVTGVIVITLMTYLVSRTGFPASLKKTIVTITTSKSTMAAGALIVVFVLLLNIFLPVYRNLNTPDGPNVILITIDTLRADHLGAYGYERDTSPNIDKLAEDGVLYENAFSQAPWTYPSLSSIHTSLYPSQVSRFSMFFKISDSLLTLAEYMKNNFYATIGVVSNRYAGKTYGFAQGFDVFEECNIMNHDSISSQLVTETAVDSINEYADNPFFLWIHYMDPHTQYNHHPEHAYRQENSSNITVLLKEQDLNPIADSLNEADLRFIADTYDEEISYTDQYVGKLINTLKDRGLYDNTIIVLTSDHGEELLDRNRFGHGETLYNEILHIPLIIHNPLDDKLKGTKVSRNVETRSIAGTIAGECGIPTNHFKGINLLRTPSEHIDGAFVFSEKGKNSEKLPDYRAVFMKEWKLIENVKEGTFELYDLSNDPHEETNLYGSERPGMSELQNLLVSQLSGFEPVLVAEPEKAEPSEEDIKQLKALGYIE
jgi:arylsulfatase A-like enzyme